MKFSKLRKRFVKKRVYSFWFHDYSERYYWNIHLKRSKEPGWTIESNGAYDWQKQIVKKLANKNFVDSFISAWKLKITQPEKWDLSYEKEIKI